MWYQVIQAFTIYGFAKFFSFFAGGDNTQSFTDEVKENLLYIALGFMAFAFLNRSSFGFFGNRGRYKSQSSNYYNKVNTNYRYQGRL